jgi:dipeptidase
MCDTMGIVGPDGVLFAKNSDRDPNEGQALEWHAGGSHPPGAQVRCTWMAVPQARETFATLISRPFWMWGAEMGSNEHGVTLGNEAVFTTEPLAATGLTGMDLLRLTLERAATAKAACETLIELLETHGQGGGCGHERRGFSYHNSYIVADTAEAYVLETAGPHWAVEKVEGVRTISNALTIPDFARRYARPLEAWVAESAVRCARTAALLRPDARPGDAFAVLRDHGPGLDAPRYRWRNGALAAPCAHAGGLIAATQTTASWVADLRPGAAQHWVTATAAPCTSLFKPVTVAEPVHLGPTPGEQREASLWWRHETVHRLALRAPQVWLPRLAALRDPLERSWLASAPSPAEAFTAHDEYLRAARVLMESEMTVDGRPAWVRRYWRRRDRRAGMESIS